MMFRQRDHVRICEDALRIAMQKAQLGCHACATGYLELAKQYGATEEQIRFALNKASEIVAEGISRRTFLKTAIAVAAGLAVNRLGMVSGTARADSPTWPSSINGPDYNDKHFLLSLRTAFSVRKRKRSGDMRDRCSLRPHCSRYQLA